MQVTDCLIAEGTSNLREDSMQASPEQSACQWFKKPLRHVDRQQLRDREACLLRERLHLPPLQSSVANDFLNVKSSSLQDSKIASN